MKITRRQLKRLVAEVCALETGGSHYHDEMKDTMPHHDLSDVPSPEDYNTVRKMMEQNPDVVDMAINIVMKLAGASCERSTAQAIIDHLRDMIGGRHHDAEEIEFDLVSDDELLPEPSFNPSHMHKSH